MYDELREMARRQMLNERCDHTLQITGLVHEVYLRLSKSQDGEAQWANKFQFLAAASEAMRRILVDHARARLAMKRGGSHRKMPLGELEIALPMPPHDLLAVHEALEALEADDPTKASLVKLHIFAGLTLGQAASVLQISLSTANRHWALAKLRLFALMR